MQAPNYNNEFIKNDQDFPALTPTSNQNPQMIGNTFSIDKDDAKKPANLQRGIQAHQNGKILFLYVKKETRINQKEV
uniref:Uncharacterized protein n=1 Tax=Panagrolaimus davidi TaxID=227884 RepID=A0A914Q1S3_9BILA